MSAEPNDEPKDVIERSMSTEARERWVKEIRDLHKRMKDRYEEASDQNERNRLVGQMQRLEIALRAIRIHNAVRGVCTCCGYEIPEKRLVAMPETVWCVQCMQEHGGDPSKISSSQTEGCSRRNLIRELNRAKGPPISYLHQPVFKPPDPGREVYPFEIRIRVWGWAASHVGTISGHSRTSMLFPSASSSSRSRTTISRSSLRR